MTAIPIRALHPYEVCIAPGLLPDLGPRAAALPGNAQKQVLGTHIAVSQLGGALLGQTEGSFCPHGKFNGAHSRSSR